MVVAPPRPSRPHHVLAVPTALWPHSPQPGHDHTKNTGRSEVAAQWDACFRPVVYITACITIQAVIHAYIHSYIYNCCYRDLFSNVKCPAVSFLMSPITAEYFTKYWVIWLLETLQNNTRKNEQHICTAKTAQIKTTSEAVTQLHKEYTADLWFLVEARKIPTNNHFHTCKWIFFQHSST